MIDTTDRFDRFHIVLVEPGESRNVGSVARAMRNLGFSNLHLVAPPFYNKERALVTACHAAPLLDNLYIHATFEEAVADMEMVIGFSGRRGKESGPFITLPEWIGPLPVQPAVRTALVFGPEDNGLRQEELDVCRWIVRIPTTGEYDSFNLSQAALLVLYEVAKTLSAAPKPEPTRPLPTMNDYFQLDRLVAGVMTESGFLREGTAAPVPGTIRNLFRRLDLDAKEMGILLGLFGKIHRRLQRDSPPSD